MGLTFRDLGPYAGMRDLVEVVTGRGDAMFDSDDEESEEEGEEEEEEGDEDEDEEMDAERRPAAKRKAEGREEVEGDGEEEEAEEDDEEEEEAMDDDQMFALDKAVGAVLRARQVSTPHVPPLSNSTIFFCHFLRL